MPQKGLRDTCLVSGKGRAIEFACSLVVFHAAIHRLALRTALLRPHIHRLAPRIALLRRPCAPASSHLHSEPLSSYVAASMIIPPTQYSPTSPAYSPSSPAVRCQRRDRPGSGSPRPAAATPRPAAATASVTVSPTQYSPTSPAYSPSSPAVRFSASRLQLLSSAQTTLETATVILHASEHGSVFLSHAVLTNKPGVQSIFAGGPLPVPSSPPSDLSSPVACRPAVTRRAI